MKAIEQNIIETDIDPNLIRTKYQTVKCRNASSEFKAELEIVKMYPPRNGRFYLEIGLTYPTSREKLTFNAFKPGKDASHPITTRLVDYKLTQEDFGKMIRDELIEAPCIIPARQQQKR